MMTTSELRIGKNGFALPQDTVTQTLGIVAQRGAGKTYLTGVISEEMIGAGLPVVIVDPMGVYWGLRLDADGKREGLPVVILGGDHADVPLEPTAGKVIAGWVAEEHRACILDLSGFRKGEQHRFVTDFAEELYRKNRDPLHLILDEADLWAPQRPMPGEQRMLGAIEDLVRRGRARGIGLSLVTQRPAVINKDVLTQVSALVALRIVGPQDRKAIEEWTKYHGAPEEREAVLSSLAALPIGTAWLWSPGWLGKLEKVSVRTRRTFDSSSTPKVGAAPRVPVKLAPVDYKALTERIAATLERAKLEDPKALREQIAELEEKLDQQLPAVEIVKEVPCVDISLLNALRDEVQREVERIFRSAADAAGLRNVAAVQLRPAELEIASKTPTSRPDYAAWSDGEIREAVRPIQRNIVRAEASAQEGPPPKIERLILTALAQNQGSEVSQARLALLVGCHRQTKSFVHTLSDLRAAGALEGTTITPLGLARLGKYDRLPKGAALLEWYCTKKLNPTEGRILKAIRDRKWEAQSDLADYLGVHRQTKSFVKGLSLLRNLGLVDGLRLSADLR